MDSQSLIDKIALDIASEINRHAIRMDGSKGPHRISTTALQAMFESAVEKLSNYDSGGQWIHFDIVSELLEKVRVFASIVDRADASVVRFREACMGGERRNQLQVQIHIWFREEVIDDPLPKPGGHRSIRKGDPLMIVAEWSKSTAILGRVDGSSFKQYEDGRMDP